MKKNILISLFVFLLFPFSLVHIASAQSTNGDQKVPRQNGIDEGILYYWLRYGGIAPDSLAETLKFLGTGFAADPTNSEQLVGALAKQWVYGSPPAAGVSNYSTSIVDDMQTAGYFGSDQANYLRSAGSASLSFPTQFEPLPDDQKTKTGAEKAELKNIADFPSLILGGANRAGNDMLLTGMALARAEDLSAAVPAPGDMLPEQVGTRNIGKDSTGSASGGGNVLC